MVFPLGGGQGYTQANEFSISCYFVPPKFILGFPQDRLCSPLLWGNERVLLMTDWVIMPNEITCSSSLNFLRCNRSFVTTGLAQPKAVTCGWKNQWMLRLSHSEDILVRLRGGASRRLSLWGRRQSFNGKGCIGKGLDERKELIKEEGATDRGEGAADRDKGRGKKEGGTK